MLYKLSQRIEENINEISREWLANLQAMMRATAEELFPTSELLELPPLVLKGMAEVIHDETRAIVFDYGSEVHTQASELGRLREAQGFKISQVFQEYCMLRDLVWDFCSQFDLNENDLAKLEKRLNISLNKLILTILENYFERFAIAKEEQAYKDELTQLYSYRFFREQLWLETDRSRRHDQPVSLLLIDVDHFKPFVESCGELGGQNLLSIYARMLEQASRRSDIIARLHGDKFAALLTNTGKQGAMVAAKRFSQALRGLRMPTVSVGIASCPEDARNPEDVMDKADEALFQAKRSGRDQCFQYV